MGGVRFSQKLIFEKKTRKLACFFLLILNWALLTFLFFLREYVNTTFFHKIFNRNNHLYDDNRNEIVAMTKKMHRTTIKSLSANVVILTTNVISFPF